VKCEAELVERGELIAPTTESTKNLRGRISDFRQTPAEATSMVPFVLRDGFECQQRRHFER
jgi:hypothetical protein